jgi:hypothetical protein
MKLKNNIKYGADQIALIISKFQHEKHRKISDLKRKIEHASKINEELKKGILSRQAGPAWSQLPIMADIWKAGCGKLWNRKIPQLKKQYKRNSTAINNAKENLANEMRVLRSMKSTLKTIQTISTKKEHLNLIPEPLAAKMHKAIMDIKHQKIIKESDILQVVIIIQDIARECSSITLRKPAAIKKSEGRIIQLLPYESSFHERIYLPIPRNFGYQANSMGAKYDSYMKKGGNYYIPENTDLKPFERFLPLAFRENPSDFKFWPKEPKTAERMNLHTLFDEQTWVHIRTTNASKTDYRCVVCGKRSGDLLDRMDIKNDAQRRDTVDCHEMWEWIRPSENVSIGIQKLKGLMTVCFKCHMAFHDDFARRRIKSNEDKKKFMTDLFQHRSFMTRIDMNTIAKDMYQLRKIADNMNNVQCWILDLSHLSQQDYIRQISPVFKSDNPLNFSPENISGLKFSLENGVVMSNRSSKEVFSDLAPRYPEISIESLIAGRRM